MSRRIERHAQRMSLKYKANFDLIIQLLEVLPSSEVEEVLEMTPRDLRPTARVNTLKSDRASLIKELRKEGIQSKALPDIPEAIEITKGANKLGSSQLYLKGHVMPQGLGSMLTVDVLDPQPGETILDMAAAPGGKSCFIGERLKGEGKLIANDISAPRLRSLLFNLTRHNITNAQVTNLDGRDLGDVNPDRILLDAPCTGTGLLVSKPHITTSKHLDDSIQLQTLQITLLQRALGLLQPGGICVYSTCTISTLENEEVIKRFTNQVDVEATSYEGLGLKSDVLGLRLFPNQHRCDGFFISRLIKK